MELKEFYLSQFSFELRFSDGYKYLDVSGEILKRWAAKFDKGFELNPEALRISRVSDSLVFDVGVKRISFTMTEVSTFDYFRDHICPIAEDVIKLLEIREPERAGVRFHLVYPKSDIGDASEAIRKSTAHFSEEMWKTLGNKYIGVNVTAHCESLGIHKRLQISTAELKEKENGGKGIPKFGVLLDFDYSAHEKLTALSTRSFMNDGFSCLRNEILPLCDPFLKG